MWTSGSSGTAVNVGSHIFLSYADEDRSVAERVVRALTSLGWQVWWDREIAPGKTFDERIGERLRSAGAVVVLWSRHSVVSEWVREEASDAKRRDVLIPALIERVEPPFGFTLRQAVDLTSWNGTSSVPEFSALLAALRELIPPVDDPAPPASTMRVDEFAWHQRIFRHATPGFLIFTLLVAIGTASSLWYWDAFYRMQVEHFANVRTRYGLPEGVGPLDGARVAHRSASLALVRHGRLNPVDEVRLVNSRGDTPALSTYVPTTALTDLLPLASFDNQRPLASDVFTVTRVTFTRDGAGGILEQNAFTAAGRLVYTLRYANRETAEYKIQGFTRAIRASGIAYVRFEYVKAGPNAGLDEKHAFLDSAQQPQPTESGAYGSRRTFDERGLVRESFPLGPTLEDHTDNSGVFRAVLSYSQLGDVTEAASFDQSGGRVTGADGVAIVRLEYDAAGNPTRFTYHDRVGQPVSSPSIGAARIDFGYDNDGRLTTTTLFGTDQRPVLGATGFARKTLAWPAPTRVSLRFYDPNFDLMPVSGFAFEVLDTFDDRGLPIEESFRDSKGAPTRIENGCSTVRLGYDAVGNNVEFRCLNEQRSLTFSTDGASIVRSRYDDRGNPVVTELFDPEGKPANQKDWYTSIRREYNAFGKLSKETHLDARGTPQKARAGYASVAYTYDRNGNRIEEAYFDERGRSVAATSGYAARRSEFDGKALETRTSFLSPGGQLVRTDEGYAAVRHEYDDRGFVIASTFLDENGRRIRSVDGYAQVRRKRNADGKLLEIAYFDDRAVPVISGRPGSGQRRWTYDALGRVIDRSDYDTTGKRITNAYGYSTIRFSYDRYGRETGRQLLDAFGRPLTSKVTVDKVVKGSVAADAGFRVGDVILTYDGELVGNTYEFANKFELFKGDRRREIRVERGGQIVGLDLAPGLIRGCELEERAYR
jgi:hypothetical protein